MNTYKEALVELEKELAALDHRRTRIVLAINTLRSLVDVDGKGDRQTDRPVPRAARSVSDDPDLGKQETGRRAKILDALKGGPIAAREIARQFGIEKDLINTALHAMKNLGLVATIGQRAGTKWKLPGAAKEVP